MPAQPAGRRPSSQTHEAAVTAALISFLFPGLGHLVVGAWARGAIWIAGWVVVTIAGGGLPILLLMLIAAVDAYFFTRDAAPPSDEKRR